MLRHVWRQRNASHPIALGLMTAILVLFSGCESNTAPPRRSATDAAAARPLALERAEESPATVVVGTGRADVDVPAVQAAVDRGGVVILKGHFSFDAPPTKPVAPALLMPAPAAYPASAEVLVSKAVTISGPSDERGEMTTIDAGTIPFYVEAPGDQVTIRELRFVNPTSTAILAYAVGGLDVTSTRIEGVVPFAHLAGGITVETVPFPTPTSAGSPEKISGTLRIERNDIDMAGGTSADNTLGITMFSVGIRGAEVDAHVVGNRIRNTTEPAINFRHIAGHAAIEHNVITTGSFVGNAGRNQAIRVANTGSFLVAHNDVTCEWANAEAEGIGVFSQFAAWPIEQALVEDNRITMSAPPGTVFTAFSAGIGVYGFANGNVIRRNTIRGVARAGLAIPRFPLAPQAPAAPADNAFIENHLAQFTPTLADYFVGEHALRTLIVGRGTVEDMGDGTVIESKPTSALETPASVRWNQLTRDYIAALATKPGQTAALRSFAYLSLAQYEAVLAARDRHGSASADDESDGRAHAARPSAAAAVAGASAVVLEYMFPEGIGAFEAAVAAQGMNAGTSEKRRAAFSAGESLGRTIGASVVDQARTDRFDAVWTGTVPVGPGLWTGSDPILPLLGQMRPFFLESGSQFRPPPPPEFGSAAYLAALREVRHISDTRTPEQLAIAQKWAGTTGSLVAGLWNTTVTDLVTRYHLDETRAAHALALTNRAAMDANIACHDGKYTYWFIRPFQADPAITTPIGRPNHPSYPSNHACASGTFAYVLGALFPAERDSLAAMANEAGESRIFAGIHYRFDKDAGLRIARQVTAVALKADRRPDGEKR